MGSATSLPTHAQLRCVEAACSGLLLIFLPASPLVLSVPVSVSEEVGLLRWRGRPSRSCGSTCDVLSITNKELA